MMTVDRKQIMNADVVLDDRAVAKALEARRLTRRGQALLAAAGQSEPASRRWYVITIDQGCDNLVDNALTNAGVEHWMPALAVKAKRRSHRRHQAFCTVVHPAFPGYMFVRVAWGDDTWEAFKVVEGVTGIIGGAFQPAPLQDKEVAKFRMRVDKDPKFIEMLSNALKAGDVVRVDDGPFAMFKGIVSAISKGGRRARVDVDILGGQVPVDLDLAQITKLD